MRFSFASADKMLGISFLALFAFGLILLSSASSSSGLANYDDASHYLKRQLFIIGIMGLPLFLFAFFMPYRFWKKAAFFVFLGNIVLLIAVFFPPFGLTLKGSSRWLAWGGYTFQPSEFLKISLIIYLAALFEKKSWQASSFQKGFIPFIVVLLISGGLVILEPDLDTTAVIVASAVLVYFFAGAKMSHFALLVSAAIGVFLLFIFMSPFRAERLNVFLNKDTNVQGSAYHITQAENIITSGGLTGSGFGQGADKYRFLPEPFEDSIFAVAAKEFGFVGASIIIACFLIFIIRGMFIASHALDMFGRLLAFGIATSIGIQAFINIAALTGLIPLAGLTLPFMSYGGTAISANFFAVGLLLNISRHQR